MTEPFPSTPCVEWTGYRDRNGYGKRTRRDISHSPQLAHRVAWIDAYGPIPPKGVIMHLCDNPPCIRLDHLRLGTHSENQKMAGERGQMTRLTAGERNGQAKLTEAKVREIRRLYADGRTTKEIAGMYDISFTNVSMITTRATWKHVT